MKTKTLTIIMAGGLGKRMKSEVPKVLNIVKNRPMICYVIEQAILANSEFILIIVGKYKRTIKEEIEKYFDPIKINNIKYIDQTEPLGTGHAIKCCIEFLIENNIDEKTKVLILSGDVPLIEQSTIGSILLKENSLLITELENPSGCGRIVFKDNNDNNYVERIVEEKDCDDTERKIKFVNCGIYNLNVGTILKCIPLIKNINKGNEYYLTDIIDIAKINDLYISAIKLPKEQQFQIININTVDDLILANDIKN